MKCPTCDRELASARSVCGHCGSQPTVTTQGFTEAADKGAADSSGTAFEEGAIIANRYRILARVGAGGMGAVYKMLDLALDRVVALKTIHPEMARNPRALELFKKELILARQVTHKNICRLFDLGEDGGVFFLTMEFLEGKSLHRAIHSEQRMSPAQAADIILQAARGLDAAHESGIVHRDLKPENIMVQGDGRVLVMDFGIARPVEEMGTAFSGTPAYASPEQLLGKPQDGRSDLFSLGLIFYELLCGEPAFPKPANMQEARDRAVLMPPLIKRHDVPKELSDIVARCLAVHPEERYSSARELAGALENWLHPVPFYGKPKFAISAAGALALLSIGLVLWNHRTPPPTPPPVSLLVADFENKTREPVFDGTLEPAVQVALEGASFITAYDRGQAKQLVSQLQHGQKSLDAESARLVAVREGIAAIVSGAVEREGARYRLSLRAVNPADGKELLKEQHETVARDRVLASVGRLIAPVRRVLGDVTPAGEQIAAAETFTAASLEAANRYSAAQEFQYLGVRDKAAEAYQEAIQLDPNMGRAYSGLAVLNRNLLHPAEAMKNYELALAHISRMSEREKLRTRGGYYITANNPAKAAEEFKELVQKYPADTGGHNNLALALLYLRQTGRALEEGRRSVEIYPKNVQNRNNVALYALYAGDYQSATREATAVLRENPRFEKAYIALALAAVAQGRFNEARDTYQKLAGISPRGSSMAASGLADLAVVQGRLDDAVNTLRRGIAADESAKQLDEAAHKNADLSHVYVKLNRASDARQAADRAAAGTLDLGALTEAAFALIDCGAIEKASAIAARFREKVGSENQVAALLIEGYSQMAKTPLEAIDILGKAQKIVDTWLGHYCLGRAYLVAKAYVEAQAEFEVCIKRSGEAMAVFLDEAPTARLLPPSWYYRAQAEEGLKNPTAKESYEHFLKFQSPQSQDPLAAAARAKP